MKTGIYRINKMKSPQRNGENGELHELILGDARINSVANRLRRSKPSLTEGTGLTE
jgi:hypothetical protein